MFTLLLVLISNFSFGAEGFFTKRQALQQMMETGIKWKQANYARFDADAKFDQANAAERIHVGFYSREMILKTNQLIYGFSNTGPLDLIGFGSSGLIAKYDFYNPGASARTKAATANVRLGEASTKQMKNDLQFLLFLRFLTAQQQKMKIEAADVSLKKDMDLFKMVQEKVKNGAGIPLDLARSEALIERDKIKKLDATAAYVRTLGEIIELTGSNISENLEPLKYKAMKQSEVESELKLVHQRPEVEVNEFQIEASRFLKQQAEGEGKATVSGYAELGSVGTQFLGLVNSPSGSLGIQLLLPLYDGGYIKGKTAEAVNKLSHVELQRRQLDIETQLKSHNIVNQLELTKQAVEVTFRQLELAKKELGFAERKIKVGSSGNLDLINAQTNYAAALEMNIQAIYSYEATKMSLFHLLANPERYLELSSFGGSNE